MKLASIGTSYKDKLRFSLSGSSGKTTDPINITEQKSDNASLGLTWNIIPFKLMWIGRYELSKNTGTSVDNNENTFSNNIKYVFDKTYSFDFGYDLIDYSDKVSTAFDYKQNIARFGVNWNF